MIWPSTEGLPTSALPYVLISDRANSSSFFLNHFLASLACLFFQMNFRTSLPPFPHLFLGVGNWEEQRVGIWLHLICSLVKGDMFNNTGSFHFRNIMCFSKLSLFLHLNIAYFKFISTCITAFCCCYDWDHLPAVLYKWLWYEEKFLIFMHSDCFWPSYRSKLLLGLLIFKFDFFWLMVIVWTYP